MEVLKNIGLLLLGAALSVVGAEIRSRWRQRNVQLRTLSRLDWIMKTIKADLYPENVGHKSLWARELDELAKDTRSTMFRVTIPLQIIARQIRHHSFSHEESKHEEYGCDELLKDLYVLRLGTLLPPPWFDERMKGISTNVIRDIVINTYGVLGEDQVKEKVNEMFEEWKKGELRFGKEFAAYQLFEPETL
jgi:hypothetical protein